MPPRQKSQLRIGMSGWTYAPWRGGFYPKGLPQKDELKYASRKVTSIEVNGTFYGLQKPASFENWYSMAPQDFSFAIKAPQFITHVLRLKECEEPLANFLASGVLCLKEKLGPILWQFPPNVTLKDDRFEKFLKLLPHTSEAAAKVARGHSSKMNGRTMCDVDSDFRVRHAFEFRHMSFKNAEFIELLRSHGVALVMAHSGAEKSPYMEDVTADFVYARMHGQAKAYKKGYPDAFLSQWAERVKAWSAGKQPKDADCASPSSPAKAASRDAFIYFDDETKERAPFDAMTLMEKLGVEASSSDAAA